MTMAAALLATTDSSANTDARIGKYLAFHLDREEFAMQVQNVREILGVLEITQVPQMPNFIKGVINLRGKVIPVIDLRLKFGMNAADYTHQTSIIVVQFKADQNNTVLMGVIVDAVSEVLAVTAADVEDTPRFGEEVSVPYVTGLAKIKGKVKILLDIAKVLTAGELSRMDIAPEANTASSAPTSQS
jgi:purine-binding chemotaxis protein CheW